MNRILYGAAMLGAWIVLALGCTKTVILPGVEVDVGPARTDGAVARKDGAQSTYDAAALPDDAATLPYDAALHPKPDATTSGLPVCLRASAVAAQASDVLAFGYHRPLGSRAACAPSELATFVTATASPAFTSLQQRGASVVGLSGDCKSCLMAEYDASLNPPGADAKWGVSGLRTDAAQNVYVLPSNRQWLNTFGCLENAAQLTPAEAQAAADAGTCRSLFCPLGSGGCGLATSVEYAQCTQFVEGTDGPCASLASRVTPSVKAKLDAASVAGICTGVLSVASVFCGGAAEPDAGTGDASLGQ